MEVIFEKLAITPKDESLYRTALTHPSANKKNNYERLEFLGDAVIELIATQYIFQKFPNYPEGKMTKLRARTVSRPTLASFARELGIPNAMTFSAGERSNKGEEKDTNLCNAFEALMGAIYLDQGYPVAESCFIACARSIMNQGYTEKTGIDNPKGKLQELLQAIQPTAPQYQLVSAEGPDHNKTFVVEVYWLDNLLGTGQGTSKQRAESDAALNALSKKMWHDMS